MADAGVRRRRDRRLMLAQPPAGFDDGVGGDDQQPVDAFERRVERGGLVEIGAAGLGPLSGEVGELGGVARAAITLPALAARSARRPAGRGDRRRR